MKKHQLGLRGGFSVLGVAAVLAACSGEGDAGNGDSNPAGQEGESTERALDESAPSVLSVDLGAPGVRAGVRKDAAIVVTFSEPMDRDSVLLAYQSPRIPSNGATFTWNSEGTVLTIDPSADLQYGTYGQHQRYTLQITSVATDLAGNSLATAYPVEFTTLTRMTGFLSLELEAGVVVPSKGDAYSCAQQTLLIGDSDANGNSKAFFTFDLSKLPGDIAEIEQATFEVPWQRTIGDPWGNLGALLLEHTDLALPRATGALSAKALAPLGSLANTGRSTLSIDVTSALAQDYAARAQRQNRSQYRMAFEKTTDNDSALDVLLVDCRSNRLTISVSYLVP
jgi:hypothetical protein